MKRIITISREFGSGGRAIGRSLADRLGFKYYDKALVKEIAGLTGFDPSFIEEAGEHSPSADRFSYLFNSAGTPGVMKGMSMSDYLWCAQRGAILRIAEEGPCVIVGRCADFILRGRDDCLNAFIHAPLSHRVERVVRFYGFDGKDPEGYLRDKDKRRRSNYKRYTGQEWGLAQNYHIALDTSVFSPDRCVEILAAQAES